VKAYRLHDFTGLDDLKLREEDTPHPQQGEVLVRVHAVSLNFRDIAMLRDRYPFDFFALFGSGARIRHISVGSREDLQDVARAIAMARIKPMIDRVFDFEDAREAFAHLESGSHFGQVVVRCAKWNLNINTHLTYQGWSEGKLNFTFMEIAKTFFVERGDAVAETFIERGYDPVEEVIRERP
jgi:NADPH:quinone reductase-like Zn-dependent oxidoreductase